MPDLRCYCVACGKGMNVAPDFAGRLVECPACHRVVPVPSLAAAPKGLAGSMPAYPPEILSVEIRFLCGGCGAKLMIDARWQGRTITCPKCQKETRVPRWWADRVPAESTDGTRLSEAEIEFLTGDTGATARAC